MDFPRYDTIGYNENTILQNNFLYILIAKKMQPFGCCEVMLYNENVLYGTLYYTV